jgi:hypothetical protein
MPIHISNVNSAWYSGVFGKYLVSVRYYHCCFYTVVQINHQDQEVTKNITLFYKEYCSNARARVNEPEMA